MAEEKRIFIQSFKNRPCVDCPAESSVKNCTCPDLYRFSHGINKSEAIEKMARAMCNADGVSCNNCAYTIYDHINGCKEYLKEKKFISFAEAALKALLEDK